MRLYQSSNDYRAVAHEFWCAVVALTLFAICTVNAMASTDLTEDQVRREIATLSEQIKKTPSDPGLYVKRGDAYFLLHEFDKAIGDYTTALDIDDRADKAYLGRGLALGRAGLIEDGIGDISVYLKRHPDSSLAYTKRGVRHLWLGERTDAEHDLRRAIELNPSNAEAHDDLGVILAQQKKYDEAITHFSAAARIDPTYQKAYHNLAMAYFLSGYDAFALNAVEKSLALSPNARDSLLLKAEILKALGQLTEAAAIKNEAEFLPKANWSERAPLQ